MDNMTFGQRVVFYRKKANMLQKELAEKAGVSSTALNYYEKDKREPNVLIIKRLAAALSITGDELLGIVVHAPQSLPQEAQRVGHAYVAAPPSIKAIVDTALEPYMDDKRGTATAKNDVKGELAG